MSARQHTPLVLIGPDRASRALQPIRLQLSATAGGYDEAWLRDLLFAHPEAVPVGEIDPAFGPLVPICTELDLRGVGYADALFLNALGLPTLVECKLWRNPEARREVVGQILDYARALRRWTYADLQREAARSRRQQGFDLHAHMRDVGRQPELDQSAFVDNVTRNLARGRVLLLVLGDGIREGVEAIADYIQGTTGLHFTFGLIEAQVFDLGGGQRIVQPRVLARTLVVNRTVVELATPDVRIAEPSDEGNDLPAQTSLDERENWMKEFWTEMLTDLRFDDAEQALAKPIGQSNVFFPLAPRSDTWLTCYFSSRQSAIGVFLGSTKTSAVAKEIGRRLESDKDAITREIGVPVTWSRGDGDKVQVAASRPYADLRSPTVRQDQIAWFRTTLNAFVNALRPRVGSLLSAALTGASGEAETII